MEMSLNAWKKAIRNPVSFAIQSNSLIRFQTKFVSTVAFIGVFFLFILYLCLPNLGKHTKTSHHHLDHEHGHKHGQSWTQCNPDGTALIYDATYPLSKPFQDDAHDGTIVFKISIITDLDENSKSTSQHFNWISYMLSGYLFYNPKGNIVNIKWDNGKTTLKSSVSSGGRGMELSTLIVFNGKLYSCDDRTGIIYEIKNHEAVPWVILGDGDGTLSKGFKCEWAAIKDNRLIIGGLGKEWTNAAGQLVNFNPQWIKKISPTGQVHHENWRKNYLAIRSAAGIEYPGYMIHESAAWSEVHQKWFFLPRRASPTSYTEQEDERKGTNLLITADEDFKDIHVKTIGSAIPTRGFSSFKFVPGSNDEIIVALKSEEVKGHVSSYITVFMISGKILFPETVIEGNFKFEGIEFT